MWAWLIALNTGVLINWCQELWEASSFTLLQLNKLAGHGFMDAGRRLEALEWETDFRTHSISSGQNVSRFLSPFTKLQFSQGAVAYVKERTSELSQWALSTLTLCSEGPHSYLSGLFTKQKSLETYSGTSQCLCLQDTEEHEPPVENHQPTRVRTDVEGSWGLSKIECWGK